MNKCPDWYPATALRDAGMAQALDHADSEHVGWSDLAYSFLCRYARQHSTFISEDVSDAAAAWGMIAPPDKRAWGSVYRKAINRGVIKMIGMGRSRSRQSVCPLWVSNLCPREAA